MSEIRGRRKTGLRMSGGCPTLGGMGLLRLIIIGVLVWLVIVLIRRQLARRDQPDALPPRSGTMVRCEQCGMHVPDKEAVRRDGHVYCSEHGRNNHL